MSPEITPNLQTQSAAVIDWPQPPTNLIFDDEEPLESNRHRVAMNLLIRSFKHGGTTRQDIFVGGNMFVYYSSEQVKNRDFRGPDFFVVLGVNNDPSRLGWVVWEEGGRYPDVIVELLSPSTETVDRGIKKDLYEQVFKTRDYFVFDPFNPGSLQGWHLNLEQGYQPLRPNSRGRLWCEALGLWLGTWDGTIEGDTATWLRFYDTLENLVLSPEEFAQQEAERERQRAEQERQRAERLAERLRQLGEDPDR
ncbi:MAG: Uma2 family endonuclease [Oscillatoriales cyanobacterium C42_A2020_001]|nr:Uma2 family endonuclease [Leptolyngbyaceae cyanobacterium C42_A2020_001]